MNFDHLVMIQVRKVKKVPLHHSHLLRTPAYLNIFMINSLSFQVDYHSFMIIILEKMQISGIKYQIIMGLSSIFFQKY